MPKINRSLLVPYTAEQMYNLVNAVDQYSEFLPWCTKGLIHSVTDTQMQATIYFSHGIINKSFTTLNTLELNKAIHMKLLEGPFREFVGTWRFEEQDPKSSNLSFELDFEFSSPLIAMAAGPVFQQAIGSMIEAFTQRAQTLYG